jgi:hypothetical protein
VNEFRSYDAPTLTSLFESSIFTRKIQKQIDNIRIKSLFVDRFNTLVNIIRTSISQNEITFDAILPMADAALNYNNGFVFNDTFIYPY